MELLKHSLPNRREFLSKTASIAAAAFLLPPLQESRKPPKPSKVDLTVVKGDWKKHIADGLDALGGISRFIKQDALVVLKPNLSFPAPPKWAVTTNPEVVAKVARLCIDAGARKVLVVDYPMRSPEKCWKRTGMEAALSELSVVTPMLLHSQRQFQPCEIPTGKEIKQVEVAKIINKADCVINLPVAKSHSDTFVSLALKNLMGLIWDRIYFHDQAEIHQAIADLATVVKPHLTILDATRALTTGGPEGPGVVEELDTLVISTDMVAVDAYGVELARWNKRKMTAEDVPYIKMAHQMGLGEMDISKLKVAEFG